MENIELVLDASYEVKYEEYKAFSTSLFRDVYRNASEMVGEVIAKSLKPRKDQDERFRKGEQICNVIAFMGKRGSGKSSALASYCKFLDCFYDLAVNDKEVENSSLDPEVRELIRVGKENDISFTVLDTMDATLLDREEKIVEIVLARMIEVIEQQESLRRSRDGYRRGDEDKRVLVSEIGEIYRHLCRKRQDEEENASVLQLKALSYSWNVRDAFKELVRKFNRFVSQNGDGRQSEGSYIVIPIDDIDMNVDKCSEMLEMIRKYLMVPQVIILLTFNFEQLHTICRNHYYSELFGKYGFDSYEKLDARDKNQILELTREYMDKVIPIGRKVYMPQLLQMEPFQDRCVTVRGTYLDGVGELNLDPRKHICIAIRYYTGIICPETEKNPYTYPTVIRRLSNFMKEFRQLKKIVNLGQDATGRAAKHFAQNMDWLYYDLSRRYVDQYVDGSDLRELREYLEENPEKQRRHLAKYLLRRVTGERKGNRKLYGREFAILEQMLKSDDFVYGNQLLVLQMARTHGFVKSNALFAWHMFLSIKTGRNLYGNPLGQDAAKLWGGWDNWAWKDRTGRMAVMRLEKDKNAKPVYQYEIGADPEQAVEDIFLVYAMLRMFFIPLSENGGDGTPVSGRPQPDGRESLEVVLSAKTDWQFCMGGWLFCLGDCDGLLGQIEREFREQFAEAVEGKHVTYRLQEAVKDWYGEYGKKKIIPYGSSLFLEQIVRRFYPEGKLKDIDHFEGEVRRFLVIVEEELEKADGQVGEVFRDCPEAEKELCFGGCAEAFRKCPVVRFLRGGDGLCEQRLVEDFYGAMKMILGDMAGKGGGAEMTEDVQSDV